MTRHADVNEQWQLVQNAKQKDSARDVEHSYRVFHALAQFLTTTLPARVGDELRRRGTTSTGVDVTVTRLSGRGNEGMANVALIVREVPRKQSERVAKLLQGIKIETETKSIECYVHLERYRSIETDLHASAFFDFAKRQSKITIVALPDEDVKALFQRAVTYLKQPVSRQHHRAPPRASAREAPMPTHSVSNAPSLPFQGRIEFSINSTTTMPPDDAKECLAAILHELEQNNPYDPQNIVLFFINLSKLEYHYLLACLGEFESHRQTLVPSTEVRNAVKLCRGPQDQFFTDRHPGVERDDIVTLTGNSTGHVFRTVVSYVQKNELWLIGDVVPEPQREERPVNPKKRPTFTLRRPQDLNDPNTLSRLVEQHETFQVIFDSEKFGVVANKRESFGRNCGDYAYAWLTGTGEDDRWKADVERRERRNLPQYVHDDSDDSDGAPAHRQPTRHERGGRGRQPAAGAHRAHLDTVRVVDQDVERLDSEQQLLVSLMSDRPAGLRKVRLIGPGGTGKTESLCCAVKKILCERPGARVLYLAFSRNACDVAARRLCSLLLSTQCKSTLMRLHAASSHPLDSDPALLPFTNLEEPDTSFAELTSNHRFLAPKDCQQACRDSRVIVTTLSVAMGASKGMCSSNFEYGKFDVVIVDEAAQCGLLEGLVAPNIAQSHGALLVLAADQKQKAPLCLFPPAKKHMHHSLFAAADQGDCAEVMLRQSHRASAALADLLSQVVYDGKLVSTKDACATAFPLWKGHRDGHPTPSRVIHVIDDSAVLCSKVEMDVVVNCVETLIAAYSTELKEDDFVILTEYKEQQKLIRERLQISGLKNVLVTDAGSFQGDERKVVLVSLVNNQPAVGGAKSATDAFPDLRTLQTMVTRAKELVIIVGNCNALMQSAQGDAWKRLLENEHTVVESQTTAGFVQTWAPIKVARAIPVKDYVPLKDRKKKLDFDPEALVLENPQDYFVGVVVSIHETNGSRTMRVRNLKLNVYDVFVDQDFSNKNQLQWEVYAFTGDIVAVRLNPELARWATVHYTELMQYRCSVENVGLLPPPPGRNAGGVASQIRRHTNVHLIDNFAAKPACLFQPEAVYSHPRGNICCILQRADVRSIPGHVREEAGRPPLFVPVDAARFPPLVCNGRGTFGRLVRKDNQLPYYHVSYGNDGHQWMDAAAQPAAAPVARLPSALPPQPCTVYRGMQCGVDRSPTGGGARGEELVCVCFPIASTVHVTLPTSDSTVLPPINKRDLKLIANQPQSVLQLQFRLVGGRVDAEHLSCRVVDAVPRHVDAVPQQPAPLGDFTERFINHALALFLLKHLHPLGLFVRQDYMVCNGEYQHDHAVPEIWMQPQVAHGGVSEGAMCATAGTNFHIMTHATQFESYYLDQVVLVLLGIATKLQDRMTLTHEETLWLSGIPKTCVTMNGWLNSGANGLHVLPPI